jgi:L,D-peptidoglycan transpeptidase YkuD (ErfK/YbiS/YcfS/YnhG family)
MAIRTLTVAIVAALLWCGVIPAQAVTPAQLNIRDAQQVIIVTSTSWTTSYAKLQTWEKRSDGTWVKPFGEMSARIGRNGFASHPTRLQNSGTTPSGNYRIKHTFGQATNPGTRMPYRDVDSNDYWVYDPEDPYTYNILEPYHSPYARWRTTEAERLAAYPTQYKYAAIISYNLPANVRWYEQYREHRTTTPANTAKGGGIFLHVNGNGATAGCVSLYETSMLKVLRWLNPTKQPRIIMGPSAVIAGL